MTVNDKLQEILKSEERLFTYLKDIVYHPQQAELKLDDVDEHLRRLGQGLQFLAVCLRETKELAEHLENGEFTKVVQVRSDNPFIGPFKTLQSNLEHLVWMTKCAVRGEKGCHVDCMGDLSKAFNEVFAQLEEQRARLEKSAHTDALTGVGNRLYFDLQVKKLWLHQQPCTVAFIDMDDLKFCNDHYGHTEGDFYIIQISNLLQSVCQKDDLLFRIGGDEFVILSLSASEKELQKRLEQAHDSFVAKMKKLVSYPCGFSFGCTHADNFDDESYNNLLLAADQKMYEYKLRKKNDNWSKGAVKAGEHVLDNNYGLESRIFEALSQTLSNRYIYACNMRSNMSRWSANAIKEFNLPGEYMLDAGNIWLQRIHPDDRAAYQQDLQAVFSGKKQFHNLQYRVLNAKGFYVMCTCDGTILKGKGDEPDIFVGTITNHGVIDTIDPVTNLGNTFSFLDYITNLQKQHQAVDILVIGISEFHVINDSYGYEAGNIILHNFAQELIKFIGKDLKLFRLNGVKFAFVMQDYTREEMQLLYDRVTAIANNELYFGHNQAKLYFGAAAVHYDNEAHAITPLLSELDYYIKMSKHEHNGNFIYVDAEYSRLAKRRIAILRDVKASVLNNCEGFYLQYQPQTNSAGRVIGAEALLRWKNVTWGVVPPLEYISYLETDIYFYDLGLWILRKAMSDGMKFLRDCPDFALSVNVSYKQLERDSFPQDVLNVAEKTGFPVENLILEFTEHCRTLNVNRLKKMVACFHSHGIRIAADDFGTGHATLLLLRDIKFDTIKIDQNFTRGMLENETDLILIDGMIKCAHKLHMQTCVEGIETQAMFEAARSCGADFYQGYLIAKPLDVLDLQECMLRHNNNC